MCEVNNAVPLILHPFYLKAKMLCWAFELNSAPAAAETWDLKGQIIRYGRTWAWIILMHHLWI